MEIVTGVIIGLIVITILVVIHELGHALVARRNGVVVEEFGIGFPPRLWSKKPKKSILGKNVTYSINALPLGGFVKLKGEHDADTGKGDFGAATLWQKSKILLAGVFMNWIAAAVLFTILALIGMPRVLPDQFTVPSDTHTTRAPVELVNVQKDSPAERAGLKPGDTILQFNERSLQGPDSLGELAQQYKGETVEVRYVRDGVEATTNVSLRADNADSKGYLGANFAQRETFRATWSAPIVGVGTTAQMSWLTLKGVGDVLVRSVSGFVLQFSPEQATRESAKKDLKVVSDSVSGPVGIFGIIFPEAGKAGPLHVVMIAAIISLTLAVMNILPIPALDGGRWAVMMVSRLLKKPLSPEREEKIHGTGFMILLGLIVLVTIADVGKF